MKRAKPTKIEWITFFVMMPVMGVCINYLLFGDRYSDRQVLIRAFPLIAVLGFFLWYFHILIMHRLRIVFPEFRQTVKRISLLVITHSAMMSLAMVLLFEGFNAVHFLGYQFDARNFSLSVLLGLMITLMATTIWEGEYIFNKWKESLQEKELLEQLQLHTEFESLKSQVNPHFLFNCFNTLSSLITEDPKQAEHFLDELSKVYRYLLRNNEDGLTTLKVELQFIRSYFGLLKSRYGNGMELKVEIDKKYETYLLPSLSLQLLIENAVKHNIISKQMPLVIDIFTTTGNKLVVNNNLQLKLVKAPSNKIGLENIQSKYELLEQDGFQVLQDDKNFTVVLPLLWSKATDNRYSMTTKKHT